MKKLGLYFFVFHFPLTLAASDLFLPSVPDLKSLFHSPRSVNEPTAIRQADAGFIVQKNWIEKDASGHFIGKMERICVQKIRINVYDTRESQWNYPAMIPAATCSTTLDSKDGLQTYGITIDLGAFIYLSKTPDRTRDVKNFSPWAFPRTTNGAGPQWPMNSVVMTPDLKLEEIAFTFENQSETFFQNQTISITASFTDRQN
jgi:hypothetical protein